MLTEVDQHRITPKLHRAYRITEIRSLNYRTKTFVLDGVLACQPGQFAMAWLPDLTEKPFSIASSRPLSLTVVDVGPFSKALHALQVGEKLWVRGPFGHGFKLEGKCALLAGGGYGIAPLFFLGQEALNRKMAVEVCIGAKTAQDILLAQEFNAAGAVVRLLTEDGSVGQQGLITLGIEQAIRDNRPDCIYACGPTRMLEAIDGLGARYGLPRQMSWESHIRCGMGLCGRCELQVSKVNGVPSGWLVCTDGPVSYEK